MTYYFKVLGVLILSLFLFNCSGSNAQLSESINNNVSDINQNILQSLDAAQLEIESENRDETETSDNLENSDLSLRRIKVRFKMDEVNAYVSENSVEIDFDSSHFNNSIFKFTKIYRYETKIVNGKTKVIKDSKKLITVLTDLEKHVFDIYPQADTPYKYFIHSKQKIGRIVTIINGWSNEVKIHTTQDIILVSKFNFTTNLSANTTVNITNASILLSLSDGKMVSRNVTNLVKQTEYLSDTNSVLLFNQSELIENIDPYIISDIFFFASFSTNNSPTVSYFPTSNIQFSIDEDDNSLVEFQLDDYIEFEVTGNIINPSNNSTEFQINDL